MQLAQPIARKGEHFSCLDLDFLVDSRRENTFGLQARQPRAPCNTHAQKRTRVRLHACPRSADGVHEVCAWYACAVRGWRACRPSYHELGQLQRQDGGSLASCTDDLRAAASKVWQEARRKGLLLAPRAQCSPLAGSRLRHAGPAGGQRTNCGSRSVSSMQPSLRHG